MAIHQRGIHPILMADATDMGVIELLRPRNAVVARIGILPVVVVEDGTAHVDIADPGWVGSNALEQAPGIYQDADIVRPQQIVGRVLIGCQRLAGGILVPAVADVGRLQPGLGARLEDGLREVDAVAWLPLVLVARILEDAQVLDVRLNGVAPGGGAVGRKTRVVAAQMTRAGVSAGAVARFVAGHAPPVVVREFLVVVLDVHHGAQAQLLEVADTDDLVRLRSRPGKDREQNGSQNRDNGDDDEQFYQSERPTASPSRRGWLHKKHGTLLYEGRLGHTNGPNARLRCLAPG